MNFSDWIAKRFNTRKWFVGSRWSEKLREKYDLRLSQSEYDKLHKEWEKQTCNNS